MFDIDIITLMSCAIKILRDPMKLKTKKKSTSDGQPKQTAMKNEQAMIAGIIEGSPEGIGVAVIRLECGCKKMAAVDKDGEPASKVIIYRDQASEICPKCKEDDGDFSRVSEAFINWEEPEPTEEKKQEIELKVLGNTPPIQ